MLFRSFSTLVLVSSGVARISHHGLICSFCCKHADTSLSLTMLELQAKQCQQGKLDPELHRAAPEVTVSARSGKSGGEAGQSKWDSPAAFLELCRLQPPRRDCQLHPTRRLRAKRENTYSRVYSSFPRKSRNMYSRAPCWWECEFHVATLTVSTVETRIFLNVNFFKMCLHMVAKWMRKITNTTTGTVLSFLFLFKSHVKKGIGPFLEFPNLY